MRPALSMTRQGGPYGMESTQWAGILTAFSGKRPVPVFPVPVFPLGPRRTDSGRDLGKLPILNRTARVYLQQIPVFHSSCRVALPARACEFLG
jgi:hypothetical protein